MNEELRNKINNYLENHSEEEVIEAFKKLGVELEEKEISDDDLPCDEALKKLQKDIDDYGNYLYNETYHPFDEVKTFASRLKKIINRIYG